MSSRAVALQGEASLEERLRPRSLDEMVGQNRLRENLGVFIRAARERKESLDHLLFHGPPGLGKTSLAHVVAREMGAQLRVTSGPSRHVPGSSAYRGEADRQAYQQLDEPDTGETGGRGPMGFFHDKNVFPGSFSRTIMDFDPSDAANGRAAILQMIMFNMFYLD